MKERTFPLTERNSGIAWEKEKKKGRERGEFEKKKKKIFYLAKDCAWIKARYTVFGRVGKKTLRSRKAKNVFQSCH